MCTLTFIPKPRGYLLGMNRDERLTRETAMPAAIVEREGVPAVYPREGATGGTWIAGNAEGMAFALLNQNRTPGTGPKLRSRGHVIPSLIHSAGMREAVQRLEALDMSGMMPFLLTGFFPAEQSIVEWKWDGAFLKFRPWTWRARHWFSSGISDFMAAKVRGEFCQTAWQRRDAGSREWLRRVHASHAPVRGSFSICMHRAEAASVSYTEIGYDGLTLDLRYHAGHPCQALGRFDSEFALNEPRALKRAS